MTTTARELQKSEGFTNIGKPLTDDINDPNLDRKLDAITACATPYLREHLLTRGISKELSNYHQLHLGYADRD